MLTLLVPAMFAGSFAPTGAPAVARFGHAATMLDDGRVLITGGACRTPETCRGEAEIYDPAKGLFEPAGTMVQARQFHTASRLSDGRVLIVGGENGRDDMAVVEIYDPSTGTFSQAGTFATRDHWAVTLADGFVLVAGGTGGSFVFDPDTHQFERRPVGAQISRGARLADGAILTMGGRSGTGPYSIYTYGGVTIYSSDGRKTLRYLYATEGEAYDNATITPLRDGTVALVGGSDWTFGSREPNIVSWVHRVNPDTAKANPLAPLLTEREGHTTTLLPDGYLLVTGGSFRAFDHLTSAELYDVEAGASRPLPSMAIARTRHRATLLRDGRVLITGGDRAELYVPDTPAKEPELYRAAEGSTQGAILHGNSARFVTPDDPAAAGDAIEIYATGLAGGAILPQVTIGGKTAEVLYFGSAPGYESLNQINVRVPEGIEPGEATVRVFDLDRPTNAVTIGVR